MKCAFSVLVSLLVIGCSAPKEPDRAPLSSPVGGPCADEADCTAWDPVCLLRFERSDVDFEGGYCVDRCAFTRCAEGTACALGYGVMACFKTCETDADCRTEEGYACEQVSTVIGAEPEDSFLCLPAFREVEGVVRDAGGVQ